MKTRLRLSVFSVGWFLTLLVQTCPAAAQFRPRNQCMMVSGSLFGNTVQISGGLPSPEPDVGGNCVETGHPGPHGIVFVDVDNPRLWTKVVLNGVQTKWNGTMPRELLADMNAGPAPFGPGWRCANCDLDLTVTGGDAAPGPNELGGAAESLAETLFPWLGRSGHFGAADPHQVTLITEGLRTGRSRLDAQLMIQEPDSSWQMEGFPVSVQLDPKVLLGPVQELVLFSASTPPATSIDKQLALWDRFPTPSSSIQGAAANFGEITFTKRSLENWVSGGEAGASSARVANTILPDDVFAQCGIQFRLVKYVQMQVDQKHLNPHQADFIDDQQPLIQNVHQFENTPDQLPGVLIAVSTPHCSPSDSAAGGFGGEAGSAPPALGDTACANSGSAPAVLSHELGHVLGLGHADDPSNLMNPSPGVAVNLTPAQCAAARNGAANLIKF